jgi:uncharacterized membrane protein (DUF4010 family)
MDEVAQQVPLLDFAIALFIGALVGIEREKKLETEQGIGIGGLRTFILFAEAGAVGAWLSVQFETTLIFAAAGAFVTAIVITGYLASTRARVDTFGLTTEVAAIVVYLLGGTVIFGYRTLSVALAIVTSAVLAYKREMHRFVERIGREDLYAGLKLLIASFIILPVLPDRVVDPWGALNPYKMWLLVILISGLSLVGYVASRWLGTRRGIPLTGFFGGLVSSTAVSLAFAKQSREAPGRPGHGDALAAGLFLAWTVMAVRVLVVVAVLNTALLTALATPMAVMGVISAGAALMCYRRSAAAAPAGAGEGGGVPLKNPFSLTSAAKFAALFAVVLLVVKLAEKTFHGEGLYAIALLAGLTDVDPIALSMAEYATAGDSLSIATVSVVIAALANTASKCGLVLALGRGTVRSRALAGTIAVIVATVAVTIALH